MHNFVGSVLSALIFLVPNIIYGLEIYILKQSLHVGFVSMAFGNWSFISEVNIACLYQGKVIIFEQI